MNKTSFGDRRAFLSSSAFLATLVVPGERERTKAAGNDPSLRSRNHPLYRVRMEISIKGNLDVPKDPLISKVRAQQIPISGKSIIDFEERVTRETTGTPVAARRYYYEAQTETNAGGLTQETRLRDEHRHLIARQDQGGEIVYSETQFLQQREIDLLQTPVCSLAVDPLLPRESFRAGLKWNLDTSTLASLLNLDSVTDSSVIGTIVSIEGKLVKMRLDGHLDATADGVRTSIDLVAKMTFDRQVQSVTWLAAALRERRDIGLAKPGFEIAATVKLLRQPLDRPNAVLEETPIDLTAAIPHDRLMVDLQSDQGGFHVFMDRQWKLISDQPGLAILRLIDNETSLAQCNVSSLPSLKPGEQWTLGAFQDEIQRTLGERFVQFIEAEEGLNGAQLRTMRVAVMGQVSELPVQWVFLQFSDDSGRRLAANFSVPSKNVEAFGGADAQLANSLQFIDLPTSGIGKGTQRAKVISDETPSKIR